MATTDEIENLFRREYQRLLNLAFRILPDEETAKDIVHNVFSSLITKDSGKATPAYLTAAVRNKCLSSLRDTSIRERIHRQYLLDEEEIESEEWPDEEIISLMRKTVDFELTPQCRRVLQLRFFQAMSYQKISDTLGISKVSVYRNLSHAIDIIRKKLKHHEQD